VGAGRESGDLVVLSERAVRRLIFDSEFWREYRMKNMTVVLGSLSSLIFDQLKILMGK
jgi:hypothetical protein